jgi:hypothetical protein
MMDYDKPAKGVRQYDGIEVTVRENGDDLTFRVDDVGGMMLMQGEWNDETKARLSGSVDGATSTCAAISGMLTEAASDFDKSTPAQRAASVMADNIDNCEFTPNKASADAESLQFVEVEPDSGGSGFHLDSMTVEDLEDAGLGVRAFSSTSTGARIWFAEL